LPAGEVHLWIAPAGGDEGEDPAAAARGILSAEEIARLGRIRPAATRRLFLTARRLLRETLSRYADRPPAEWRFVTNAHGKPRLAPETGGAPLSFNLSHTAGIAVLAVTRGAEIGLDVERTDRRVQALRLAERFFSPGEAAALAALPPEAMRERFFHHWTLKEACLKALGRGLSLPIHSIAFALAGERPFRIAWRGEGLPTRAGFRFALVEPLPATVAAICLAGDGPPLVLKGCLVTAGKVAALPLEPLGLSAPGAGLSAFTSPP
jgi:4'-phosphopantetheinyl transferase